MANLHRVSRETHDRCLRACWDRKADLAESEILTLNIVAGAWASGEPVNQRDFRAAQKILARLDLAEAS